MAGRSDSRSQAAAIAKVRDASSSAAEIREHLNELMASPAFRGSVRSQRFLAFVVENALEGRFDRLGERELGVEIFDRNPSYDTGRDATVRVAASDVRSRLIRYYSGRTEGAAIRIDLPAGSYIPEFRGPDAEAAPPPIVVRPRDLWRGAALTLAVLLVASLAWIVFASPSRQSAEPWSQELDELWRPFVNSRTPLLISVGNPLFAQFDNKTIYRDPSIEKWEDLLKAPNFEAVRKAQNSREARPAFYYAAVGDVNAAFLLGQRLGPRQRAISLVRSSQLLWQQMADANVLLIGPPRFFVDRMGSMPVSLEIIESPDGFRVVHPQPGEPDVVRYRDPSAFFSEDGKASVLVTHAPGPVGNTDVETFASNSTFGRVGAVEAFTDPVFSKSLISKMRGPRGRIPRYFQVLLTVTYKGGVPTETTYLLHRELRRRE